VIEEATQDKPGKGIIVWTFNEMDKNSFNTFPPGVGSRLDFGLMSVHPEATGEDLFKPTILMEQGYSAKRLLIHNKQQLDTAIEAFGDEMKKLLEVHPRAFFFLIPFWYKIVAFKAFTVYDMWDRVTAVEAALQKVHGRFIQSGNGVYNLPTGLIYGRNMSIGRGPGTRQPNEIAWYRKLPPTYQYFRFAPIHELVGAAEEPYIVAKGSSSVDWSSFRDEDDEGGGF